MVMVEPAMTVMMMILAEDTVSCLHFLLEVCICRKYKITYYFIAESVLVGQ